MMNLRNYAVFEGRLTHDPKIMVNKDGSRKVLLTIACQNNYESTVRDEQGNTTRARQSEFVQLEAFISKENKTNGAYAFMEKGDLVGIHATVKASSYIDAAGQKQYRQCLLIKGVDLKETKTAKAARKARNAANTAPANAGNTGIAAQQTAPAPVAAAPVAPTAAINPAAMSAEQYQAYLAACAAMNNPAAMPFASVQ